MKLVISPGRTARNYWQDPWRYRELMGMLAWRDITVRYKQTVLGIAWVVVQPLVTVVIFTFVFGTLAGMSPGDPRYALVAVRLIRLSCNSTRQVIRCSKAPATCVEDFLIWRPQLCCAIATFSSVWLDS